MQVVNIRVHQWLLLARFKVLSLKSGRQEWGQADQKLEDGDQKLEDGDQKPEDGNQKPEDGTPKRIRHSSHIHIQLL